ncbi:MAG TPA: carotenoid oxygenase family protein [Nonomuraea sp.]|nr:carotenoid oxygenase family protein [Nonomuraea sp.]
MTATPYRGGFTPVTEEITAFDLPVTGRIPAELNGRYLRNGPNPLSLDDPSAGHLFLGEGMVHGVRLRDGRAEWYRNRWVRNAEVARRLGEEPRPGPVHAFDFAANTHVIGLAGRTFATVEAGALPYELSYELDTVGSCDFDAGLPGGFAAHTHADPVTGELHAMAYYFGWDHHQHIVIDPKGVVTQVRDIPVPDAPMLHDFALTQRYVVIYDLPVTFSMAHAERGVSLPYAWNDAHGARVGLLPREGGGDVRWFEVEPCWVFHTLNAYDDGDEVVVDVVSYPKRFVDARLDLGGLPALDRWRIDPRSGRVVRTRLDDRAQEFPRMDERRTGRAYRYGYTAAGLDLNDVVHPAESGLEDLPDSAFENTLIKHDLERGTRQERRFAREAYCGEPVFVAAGDGSGGEDDGYVLAYVNNPDRGAADLVILSAQDFTGDPVATVHLPSRIPLGFHGNWLAD